MFGRIFTGNVRRFVRVPSKAVYESLLYFLREDLKASVQSEDETMMAKARLKVISKTLGVSIQLRVVPEGEASTIELSFSYRGVLAFALTLFIGITLLGIIFLGVTEFSMILFLFGLSILFLSLYFMGSASDSFVNSVNEFALLLERDHEQKMLLESRKRWQEDPRRPDYLYSRLLEKHTKMWGDAHVLEYKISEYVSRGLNREEAIRKVAEDEGIF